MTGAPGLLPWRAGPCRRGVAGAGSRQGAPLGLLATRKLGGEEEILGGGDAGREVILAGRCNWD